MKENLSKTGNVFLQSFWQHYIPWIFLITAVYTAFYAMILYATQGELIYVDTDCYTRALRMVDWLQNFEWQEKIFPYSNHPNGFILHFTRICDVIWLLFTLPFLPFLPLKDAVFYGGFFFSPFFMFLTLITLLWGIKPYLSKATNKQLLFFIIFICSFVFCCKLTEIFDFYHPDHHCITCFAFAFVVSAVLRSYVMQQNHKELFAAGIFTGLGLWASSAPEGFYMVGAALIVLVTDVIFSEKSTKNPLYYTWGFFYANLAAWLINPPFGGYHTLDNARLSIIHVTLSAFMLVSFAVWHYCNFKEKSKQILYLSGFAVISGILMLVIFGTKTLFTPIYDEYVSKYFVPCISEMAPTENFLLPPVAIGMIIASYLSFKTPGERCLALLYFITAPLSMWIARFYSYYLCVWIMLYAYGLIFLWNMKNNGDKYKTAAFIYLIWPIFYLAVFDFVQDIKPDIKLNGVVLAETFDGPELIWRYNVDTVASPYHTNVEGIKDNRIMWFTTDEDELKTLLKKHNVTYITLHALIKSEYYANPKDNTDKLYGKVLTDIDIYPWMEKTDDKTYRVNYDKF